MAKRLNWMLSGTPAKRGASRALRTRLAATTILAVAPFLGYGRPAYAACVLVPPSTSTYNCSGTSAGEAILDVDNASATTLASPPFQVTDEGVIITGDGHLRFTDNNASSINNDNGAGLRVTSDGDLPGTPGAVTIITNGTISGYRGDGIYAYNDGSGDISITADGRVTGITDELEVFPADGIYAKNYGKNLFVTTGAESYIYGTENGIDARNYSNSEDAGNLEVTADGYVTGFYNDGIHAINEGVDLIITTGAASVVRGGGHGIGAYNLGSGNLNISADGLVGGYSEDGDGIHAYNSEDGEDVTIVTGAESDVFGGKDGIDARNFGQGFLNITAKGVVTGGEDGDGIYAVNVYGGFSYFNPERDIERFYSGRASDLTITTEAGSVVSGGDDGIDAFHSGDGVFEITVNGSVTGRGTGSGDHIGDGGDGIYAFNASGFTTLLDPPGSTPTVIIVGTTGLAQGDHAGINAKSDNGQSISITNDGLVRNLSAESHDLAITTYGGTTNIANNGNLIGTVLLSSDTFFEFDDRLDNDGLWNFADGTSDFGEGFDVVNNTGLLVGADGDGDREITWLRRVEEFSNSGLVSLVDGKEGDELHLGDQSGTDFTDYDGDDGRLAVDAALGPGSDPANDHLSDELFINGDTTGTTSVHVNVVAVNGVNTVGIPVVRVENGTTEEDHFNLNGPVSGGFFTWDLRLDETNNWHELYTITDNNGDPVLGGGSFEFPSGAAATQDIWLMTIGTLLHRQADLRSLLHGMGVTPVADYSEPVEPTPVAGARMAPGFWYKAFGAYIDRDDEQDGFDLDRSQTIYGGMAGFDFGTDEAIGDALLFGVFGGYIVSDLDFKATNTEWSFEGPTVGAYVTYLDQAFYADLTVKADFLDIDIDPEDLALEADDSETDAVSFGGRLDAGYKFGHTAFIEPQASLAVVHTEIDDVDIFGGTVEFEDETSVRGRLGLRLGVDHTHADATVYTADVTASVWENFTGDTEVTIVDTGVPAFGVSDDAETTYGDLSLGLSAANPDGWSSFVRGNYLFAEDYEAFTGNAGVRFVW